MSEQSARPEKNTGKIDIDKKKGLLDQLNVPPKIINFINSNAKNLVIMAICLLLIILGWTFYDFYTEKQSESSTVLLSEAFQEEDATKREQLLENVIEEYPGTDAANWSRLELAHALFDAGKYKEAAEKYESVAHVVSADSPLMPLVQYSLAQTYEAAKLFDKALASYGRLTEYTGFAGEGFLGMGRMYEHKNEMQKARESYEKVNGIAGVSETVKDWIAVKLAKLPPSQKKAE